MDITVTGVSSKLTSCIQTYHLVRHVRSADMKNNRTDDWTTPEWLMTTFMERCFDPCPTGRQEWFDGLAIDWKSPAYVNPPYSNPKAWVTKAIEQQNKGIDVVMLLRVDPSTKWYKMLIEANAHFFYPNERLYFSGTSGSKRPNFASMLVFLEGKHE